MEILERKWAEELGKVAIGLFGLQLNRKGRVSTSRGQKTLEELGHTLETMVDDAQGEQRRARRFTSVPVRRMKKT